jgi:hypothetical protein
VLSFRCVLRAADRLAADLPTCVGVRPPARPAITTDSHLALSFSSAGLSASGSHRLPLQQLACAGCCCNPQLALAVATFRHTGGVLPTRIGCSALRLYRFRITRLAPCASTSGWAFDAPLTSTEPCIAGKPSMSIPFPPVRASSGSASLTTFDLRRLLQSLAQPAIPLRLSPQVSPSGWADGDLPTLIGFSFHQPFRQPTPDALLGSSVEVTLRRFNLWKQVQKSSKIVNFTKVGAIQKLSNNVRWFLAKMSRIGQLLRRFQG